MQLTLQTDLALRLLIVLARGDGEPLSLPNFAAQQNVSYHHISKVGQALVHAGLVESIRGRSGGMRLARDPATVRIGDVVRLMEPGLQLADCGKCWLNRGCGLNPLLGEAVDAFLATLDAQTLADVARPLPSSRQVPAPAP